MPRDNCNVCCNPIELARNKDSFMAAVLQILCDIQTNTGGGSGGATENVNLSQVGGVPFTTGQQLAAGSLPVVLPAAQITTLTPPTHVSLDAGSNNIGSITDITGTVPLPTGAATAAKQPALGTASTASADVLSVTGTTVTFSDSFTALSQTRSFDASTFRTIYVQVTGTFTGTLVYEGSNDNTNFIAAPGFNLTNSTGAITTGLTATGMIVFPVEYRYFRARVSAYTSGTIVSTIVGSNLPSPLHATSVSSNTGYVGGNNVSVGTGVSGTGVQRVVLASDGNPQVNTVQLAAGAETAPAIGANANTQLLAANASRKYIFILNSSGANIAISLTGLTLTGITTTTASPGMVIVPGGHYESPPNFAPTGAITVYSGAATSAVYAFQA